MGAKPETAREAVASAVVRMSAATLALALGGSAGTAKATTPERKSKGDVLSTARLAAIAALKRTADWIPLCHPVRLTGTDVQLEGDPTVPGIRVRVTARAFDRTGVEMEAMVGAAAAALTIYDMVKGVERGVEITDLQLEEKRGGRTGVWRRAGGQAGGGRVARAPSRRPPTSKDSK